MAELAQTLTLQAKMNAMMLAAARGRGFDEERRVDLPVVDQTGLTGTYDFDLEWMPPGFVDPGGRGRGIAPPSPSTKATSLFEALEAVGLKLDKGKYPFDWVVVDHIERAPTANE